MRLGKQPAVRDKHRLAAAAAFFPKLPRPLLSVDNTNGLRAWGMMRNDSIGCCTIAALAHAMQVSTMLTQRITTPTDGDVVARYSDWCGYVPGRDETDNGGVELDVLRHFQLDGWGRERLLNFASLHAHDIVSVQQCIQYFGSCYMGASLPMAAQKQNVWDVVRDDGGTWGGHAMTAVAYDQQTVTFITWGQLQRATWAWWLRYVDECHCLLLQSWLQHYPSAALQNLLQLLHAVPLPD